MARVGQTLVVLMALGGLASCAELVKRPQAPLAVSWAQPIERVPVRRLEAREAPAGRPFSVAVRGPDEADTTSLEKTREITREFASNALGLSALGSAEAFLLPTFFSGGVIAGALILAPLATGLDAAEQKNYETVTRTLRQVKFVAATQKALEEMAPAPAERSARDPVVRVIILAYGLVNKHALPQTQPSSLCLVMDAELVVLAEEREVFRDVVHLEPYRRSADAPPPVCADLAAFAQRDGATLANAVHDYAQVLAVIAADRLRALPWKR